ncbi:hypothetical protein G6F23_016005 [Rhizopus arrhizus]|nr:hypothetical protein G6F23_016005 [Rhizopus arrhizus]
MALEHVGQAAQFVGRVDRARRVAGRVHHQPLGARRDGALQRFWGDLVVRGGRGLHRDRRAAVDQHHVRGQIG